MRTLYESLLDVEDNISKSDDIALKQAFLDWLPISDSMKKYTKQEIEISDNKIEYEGLVSIDNHTKLLPEFIKIDWARTLSIYDNQQFFDSCKSQLPSRVRSLTISGIDIQDFEIETFNADFYKDVKSIKNVTLTIPEQRLGLTRNVFYINFQTAKRNIEGLKINGWDNIIVNSANCEIGNFMVNQIKYEVSSYKRKNGPFKSRLELDKFIMEMIYKHLPMDHIDKYWKGVRRIIFKDKSGGLRNGVGLGFARDSYLKPGDFMIEKMVGGMKHDQWVPIQKMFKIIS